MSYLFENSFHLKRINVFELGSNKHAGDPCDMELTEHLLLWCEFKVPVHKTHCEEESLVIALEVSEHLDHPVYHSCAQALVYLRVVHKAIRSVIL